jgi:hypothetical protein
MLTNALDRTSTAPGSAAVPISNLISASDEDAVTRTDLTSTSAAVHRSACVPSSFPHSPQPTTDAQRFFLRQTRCAGTRLQKRQRRLLILTRNTEQRTPTCQKTALTRQTTTQRLNLTANALNRYKHMTCFKTPKLRFLDAKARRCKRNNSASQTHQLYRIETRSERDVY